MRIDGTPQFTNDRIPKNAVENKTADSFASVMKKSQSALQMDSLHHLMKRVDVQGHKLAKQKTLENLMDYKNVVKQFITESLSYGLKLTDKQSFHPQGGIKSHQLVEVIDEKLLALSDGVLADEEDGIHTLELVGEIKGLLINLYM